jgi:N-hydroxyarylamine O-acetyltransferase
LLGRVLYSLPEGAPIPGRTHQISLVELASGLWITDVGFGGATLREPIPLAEAEHEQGPDRYRLARDPEHGWMLHGFIAGRWHRLYAFSLDRVHFSDRVISNHYTSTHPNSAFRAGPRAARILPRARIALWDKRLRRYEDGRFVETELPRGEALLQLLRQELGIELDRAPDWGP